MTTLDLDMHYQAFSKNRDALRALADGTIKPEDAQPLRIITDYVHLYNEARQLQILHDQRLGLVADLQKKVGELEKAARQAQPAQPAVQPTAEMLRVAEYEKRRAAMIAHEPTTAEMAEMIARVEGDVIAETDQGDEEPTITEIEAARKRTGI